MSLPHTSNNKALGRTPEQYSTNPSTIKARRRKMNLNGAKKVEDAARTADYKAMIYARKVVQAKSEFLTASAVDKPAMLEKAMRETMEKRRAKGQDTMSKMAAYNAGLYRERSGTTGPQTSVPIADFLQNNGYVPPSASRGFQGRSSGATADIDGALTPCPTNTHLNNGNSASFAPVADMTGDGPSSLPSPHRMDNGPPTSQCSAPGFAPNGRLLNDGHGHSRRSSNLFINSQSPAPHNNPQPKASNTPAPFADMTPEPSLIPSIEGDGTGDVLALRKEVFQLRNMCHNALAANNARRENEDAQGNGRSDAGADQNGVINLDRRLNQLEGIVHTMQNISMTAIVDRVVQLERVVDDLKVKVGDGCEAEVAKMREVFGSLREALVRVGNFL